MKPYALFLLIISLSSFSEYARGQDNYLNPDQKGLIRSELTRYKSMFKERRLTKVAADDRIDVKYYLLDIKVTTSPQYLTGRVLVKALSQQNSLGSVSLDLMNSMTVDSVKVGGSLVSFTQHPEAFDITLDRLYNTGEMLTAEVYYRGVPGSSGFGSFEFSTHGGSTPWVWSLSEPYGAKDWWPCKDHPFDKADSADMFVTCGDAFKVGSNGKLVSALNNGNGTVTYHWKEGYPISTYLISIAITNYSQFSNWFKYTPTDSMEVLNYVLPEDLSSAMANLPRTVGMLSIYSDLFGLYPFINEKYGHSEFGWGGGMEHQTMTSLGGFGESLVAHELAHQWFGDMITCRTWPDIWLNEGFATYLEVLYQEKKYGTANYWSDINSHMNRAKNAVGTIYVQDSSNVNTLFDGNLVYSKGGTVLHMLRHVLGDSTFFHAMYNYAHAPSLRFGTASTEDFRGVCESTSGKNLAYFFNEWIHGEKYPNYLFSWSSQQNLGGGSRVTIVVTQTTGTSNPAFFTMPIDFRITGSGLDTTVTVFNDSMKQTFSVDVSKVPTSVQLDPQGWILKIVSSIVFAATPASLDFDSVIVNTTKKDSVTIRNPGTSAMVITSAASDEGEFTVTPTTASIAPSGSRKFYITYQPAVFGVKTGHIIFLHNGPSSPDRIGLTGFGADTAAVFTASPESLDFGRVTVNSAKTDSIMIINPGMAWLYISSATSDSEEFSVVPAFGSVAPAGGSMKFYITFAPTDTGKRTSHLTFVHNGSGSPGKLGVVGTGADTTTSVRVLPSWNIVSLPFAVTDPRKSTVFPNAKSEAFSYSPDSGYVSRESLIIGVGYWLKFDSSENFGVEGIPILADTFSVIPGWNLIGSISDPVPVQTITSIPPGMVTSDIFGYTRRYAGTDTVYPGKGYWVKVQESGSIILSSNISAFSKGRIRIVTISELPPPPPQGVLPPEKELPSEYALEQNYPNPFNPATKISYRLPFESKVSLKIYDCLGQTVAVLADEIQNAGYESVSWEGTDVASGIYYYRLEAASTADPVKTFVQVRKMLLMR